MPRSQKSLFALGLTFVGVAAYLLTTMGCGGDTRSVGGKGGVAGATHSTRRSQSLLTTVASQLADLPEQSIIDLRPPSIVLNAKKSSDGQDITAFRTSINTEQPYPNALRMDSDNASFSNVVDTGDIVRWYADRRSELDEDIRNSKKNLSASAIYAILTYKSEAEQNAIANAQASRGDTQLQRILSLPADQRAEVMQSLEAEINNSDGGEIFTDEAFELTVTQVVDSRTLLFDLDKFEPEVQVRMPIGKPENTHFKLEISRYRDSRFNDLVLDLMRYRRRGVPLLGWEPSPDQMATEQIVERLNQWLRQTSAKVEWSATPLMDTLPKSLIEHPKLKHLASPQALERDAFSLATEAERAVQSQGYEGRLMQEASWMHDLSQWLTAGEIEPVAQVNRIFDWTIRQLQLEESGETAQPYRPWQSLAHGHATMEGRGWVFAQICRQMDVPVVAMRPAGDQGPLWCAALIEGQLYLYDPQLGLPLQTAEGNTLTLAQLQAEPALTAQFDLEGTPYLPEGTTLEEVPAQIIAGPFALSRRAALLEDRMAGSDALLVYVDAEKLTEDLDGLSGVGKVTLWSYPFQTIADQLDLVEEADPGVRCRKDAALEFEPYVYRPRLWKARLLHFRGLEGETIDTERGNLKTEINDHRAAGRLYTDEKVRPTDATIAKQETEAVQRSWTASKENATFWQGLLSFDRGDYLVATEWLSQASQVDRWQPGASYNLARAYEALGETDKAIELLEASTGPQARGNQLRAKRLKAE